MADPGWLSFPEPGGSLLGRPLTPVAAVGTETPSLAAEAVELIEVDYERDRPLTRHDAMLSTRLDETTMSNTHATSEEAAWRDTRPSASA